MMLQDMSWAQTKAVASNACRKGSLKAVKPPRNLFCHARSLPSCGRLRCQANQAATTTTDLDMQVRAAWAGSLRPNQSDNQHVVFKRHYCPSAPPHGHLFVAIDTPSSGVRNAALNCIRQYDIAGVLLMPSPRFKKTTAQIVQLERLSKVLQSLPCACPCTLVHVVQSAIHD